MIIPAKPGPDTQWALEHASHLVTNCGASEVLVVGGYDGAGHARNDGAAQAKGDILVFMDADAWLFGDLRVLEWLEGDYWTPKYWEVSEAIKQDLTTAWAVKYLNFLAAFRLWPHLMGPFISCTREAYKAVHLKVGGWGAFIPDAGWEDTGFGVDLMALRFKHELAPLRVRLRRPFKSPWTGVRRSGRKVKTHVPGEIRRIT